jgi:hypothetical protein
MKALRAQLDDAIEPISLLAASFKVVGGAHGIICSPASYSSAAFRIGFDIRPQTW